MTTKLVAQVKKQPFKQKIRAQFICGLEGIENGHFTSVMKLELCHIIRVIIILMKKIILKFFYFGLEMKIF